MWYNTYMETVICEICKSNFKVKKYRRNTARFCSSSCYGIHQSTSRLGIGRKRIIVQCDICGSDIEKQPSAVKAHNFCGRQCFGLWRSSPKWCGENNPSWLGGNSDYRGPNWKEQRAKALERDSNTCQHCGIFDIGLHVHHIKPYHLFDSYLKANRMENLISLCPGCHSASDNLFWQQYPNLITGRRVPNCITIKKCKKCNDDFEPRSPATETCDNCCTFACANCNNFFYSRKTSDRTPKYCSRKCRNIAIKAPRKFCIACGAEFSNRKKQQRFCSHLCAAQNNPHWINRSNT